MTSVFGFGVSISRGVPAFPSQEDADPIAARLAKFGVNIVRFHHLDATWYSTALIDYNSRRHSGGVLLVVLAGLLLARSKRPRPADRYRLPSKW